MTADEGPLELPGTGPFDPELSARLRDALARKGPDYRPRTHHLRPDGSPRFVNRLIFESSPYLLQHAHNPVSWYPWGDEAFDLSAKLSRPVLLSVGYSTCHWCHVMERESFEDEEIAGFINSHFIPIKVDREERPDVDSVYMAAVQIMTGGGGWPMTVVMGPDRRPFFGGTYFPARSGDRGAHVGFLTILDRLSEVWREHREQAHQNADELSRALQRHSRPKPPSGMPGAELLVRAARALAQRFDRREGGFGSAPKFPRPSTYELMLRYARRAKDEAAQAMVDFSLAKMAAGGIYDQLGGGFHRYSTDDEWLVPHFEKMLYDNAQMVSVLLEAYQATGDQSHARIARETLDYVAREMTSPEGAFYSATDADSEGHEGLFFVWTPEQIEGVIGKDRARVVNAWFGVTQRGNFEGRSILHRRRPAEDVAQALGMPLAEIEEIVRGARAELYNAREKRIHPLRDDKVLTEWNAQMISAFARGGFVLDEPRYLELARRAADFLLAHLEQDGRLLRAWREGTAKHMGVLEDHAFLIAAMLDLFEATSETRWLELAIGFERVLEGHFWDPSEGGFFNTADDAESLLVREKSSYDGAQPAGSSVQALNLLRLHELTGKEHHRKLGEQTLLAMSGAFEPSALAVPKLATALDYYLDDPKELVVVAPDRASAKPLVDVIRTTFVPNKVLVMVDESDPSPELAKLVPLIEGKTSIDGQAAAYVCVGRACLTPATTPEALAAQLAEVKRLG